MEQHIRLLDCTLRDGGHVNNGEFGETAIKNIIARLVEAQTDIIEVGFLWESFCGNDIARYYSIDEVKKVLPADRGISKFSLMADFIDLDHLEPYDGTIEYIRLSFKRHRLEWGLKTAAALMEKGYKCFINPVNCNVYSDRDYLEILEKVNKLNPYGFSIVDTFGAMRISDLSHRYFLVENNLNPNITIGLHLHENLGLAYSLAQHFINIANPRRNIIIDGALLGMGRVPGNLCIEQIMDYMNNQFRKNYIMEPVYDAIDDYIAPVKKKIPWGYDIPYALSAKYNLHRTYAEYLIEKKRLKTKDIQRILSQIDKNESEMFNEQYIEKLYLDYMNVKCNENDDMKNLCSKLAGFKEIMIIAPGKSIIEAEEKVKENMDESTCVISINFIPEFIVPDYAFLTNTKRYDTVREIPGETELIITSNLIRDVSGEKITIPYSELVYFDEEYSDDSTLMLLNLLRKAGVRHVKIAGFDGESGGVMRYYRDNFSMGNSNRCSSFKIAKILKTQFPDMHINFLTPSEYSGERDETASVKKV